MRCNVRLIPDLVVDEATFVALRYRGCEGAEISALVRRRKEILRSLLEDIPEEQAEALAMRAVLGWSIEEIAVACGAPINTIRSRLRLAKEALRRKIESAPGIADELGLER